MRPILRAQTVTRSPGACPRATPRQTRGGGPAGAFDEAKGLAIVALITNSADVTAGPDGHQVIANIEVLIPPDGPTGKQRTAWTSGRYTWMRYVVNAALCDELYRERKYMIEPVFGHTRHNRGLTHFLRRGWSAVRSEWRFLMITHNLTKVHRH